MNSRKQLNNLDDTEIISLYKEKDDIELIGILYQRYTQFVFLVSMKYLKDQEASKDASMQVFEKLITDLHKHEVSNFKSWLYRVTVNHCLMQLRGDKSELKFENDFIHETETFVENDVDVHLREKQSEEEKIEYLTKAISELNKEQEECVKLFYLQEKSYKEVSDITGYDLKQVKSYIQNGKRNLKNILEKTGLSCIMIFIYTI